MPATSGAGRCQTRSRGMGTGGATASVSGALSVSLISRRTTPMSGSRSRRSLSRQPRSSLRTAAGVLAGRAFQSGSARRIAAIVSDTSSPGNARRAREHLVEHAAERPDVAALVHGLPARLLRTHVRGRAENDAHLRHGRTGDRRRLRRISRAGTRIERLRQSEVQHLHRAIRSHLDIRGFQIAMDDAVFMRGFERVRDLARDRQRLVERNGTLRDAIGERGTLDQFQHQRLHAVGFFESVDATDVGDGSATRGLAPRA